MSGGKSGSSSSSSFAVAATWPVLGSAALVAAFFARDILVGPMTSNPNASKCGGAGKAKAGTCTGSGGDKKCSAGKGKCEKGGASAVATAAAAPAAAGAAANVDTKHGSAGTVNTAAAAAKTAKIVVAGKPAACGIKVRVVPMTADHLDAAAAICEKAFNALNEKIGADPEFNPGLAKMILGGALQHPKSAHAVVALHGSRVIGSNVIDISDSVGSIGPISVDPAVQSGGAGKAMMQAVVAWGLAQGVKDIRLTQNCDNHVSWSIYTKLGFNSPLTFADFRGPGSLASVPVAKGLSVRKMTEADIPECDALHRDITGLGSRANTLGLYLHIGLAPLVCVEEKSSAIVGYTASFRIDGHTVARTEEVVQSLLTEYVRLWQDHPHGAAAYRAMPAVALLPLIHVPVRLYPTLSRWCLAHGMVMGRQNTSMQLDTPGAPAYADPKNGLYLQSIGY